jgi:hypothetical protein
MPPQSSFSARSSQADVTGALAPHYHVAPVSRRLQQHGLGKIAVRVEHREALAGSEVLRDWLNPIVPCRRNPIPKSSEVDGTPLAVTRRRSQACEAPRRCSARAVCP